MTIGQDTIVELYLDEVWTDISAYVRADPGVTITFGVRNEAGTADPSECTLIVNNRDGRFTPKNAEGAWYGLLKRGLPLRVTVDTAIRYVGEVSEYPARWDPSGNDVWVPLTASGVLRRLVRSRVVQSPLRAFLSKLSPAAGGTVTGYWPMEDAPGSTSFASGFAGGQPMTFIGSPGFREVAAGPASGPIASMELVQATGRAIVVPGSTEFTLGFLFDMSSGETANNARLAQVYTNGTAQIWVITYETGGTLRLRVYQNDATQTEIENSAADFQLDVITTQYVKLEVTQSGGNINWALSTSGVGTVSDSITSQTVTSPGTIIIGTSQSITGTVGIGHVVLASTDTALVGFDMDDALRAFAGESVEDRMVRVAEELAGVNMTVLEDGTVSQTLGAQPQADPLTIMRDAEAADAGGILRDSLNVQNSIVYMTRRARYNDGDNPILELDYAAGHLAPPLEPVDDDQLLANDVTVTREGGSSARAVDVTGPLNSLPWPDGIGVYEKAVTLNVETDEQLPALAGWLLTLGTIDETRFPTLTVDLTRWPSLTTDVEAVRPGYPVTVTNLPDYAGATDVTLHALGWTEQITSHRRIVTFNCAPASVYTVLVLDDPELGRLDSTTTTLNEALDATETGVDYTGDTWITTATHPTEFPFNIVIGGEEMTVTAATGTTFTVTRSANGVTKTHASGAPIRLAHPNRIAL